MERGVCEVCGTNERVHAHHSDYAKPLDVRWLCFVCHQKTHPVDSDDKAVKFGGAKKARLSGQDNPNASLRNQDVAAILKMLEIGISQAKIGRAFGVSQVTISRIKLGKRHTGD